MAAIDPPLLPRPRRVRLDDGVSCPAGRVGVEGPPAVVQALEAAGLRVSKAWNARDGTPVRVEIAAAAGQSERHRIEIRPTGVSVRCEAELGALRAAATLGQLARVGGGAWPCGDIEDEPAMAVRGVLIDISRDKVPTMETLRGMVALLAGLKFNRLELYTEHAFAYPDHPDVWAGADPITPDELRELDRVCAAAGIELVGNQNSLGHMERWLTHDRYADLAEAPEGWGPPWGGPRRPPATLNPVDPRSLELVQGLHRAMLACLRSRTFNVNCDEPWELGQGKSRTACGAGGPGAVYLNYLLALHRHLAEQGARMEFWGDVARRHPDIIPRLPRDATVLEWGYEADEDFGPRCATWAAAGQPFVVCPGTASWNSIGGRWTTAWRNIGAAITAAMQYGARGVMVTDWGDGGHWHPWPVSWLPLAAAACAAWEGRPPDETRVLRGAGAHLFADLGEAAAVAARDLADAYRQPGPLPPNASVLYQWLQPDLDPSSVRQLSRARISETAAALAAMRRRWQGFRSATPAMAGAAAEFGAAARLLHLACRRAEGLANGASPAEVRDRLRPEHLDAAAVFQRQWLRRNRPGGLDDSTRKLLAWIERP